MKQHDSIEELNRLLKIRLEEMFARAKDEQPPPRPVITITREPGCGAESIDEMICSELGLHLYDWDLVQEIAKDERVSARLVSDLEKNPPNWFADYLADFNPDYSLTSEGYIGSLKKILLTIAAIGNAVIVGRGSNFFLPPERKIGVCFIAPLDLRITNIRKELGVTEKEARRHISKIEAEHRKLVKKYLQADIRDPSQYHLVVNTAFVKPDTIVQLLKTMINAFQEEKGK